MLKRCGLLSSNWEHSNARRCCTSQKFRAISHPRMHSPWYFHWWMLQWSCQFNGCVRDIWACSQQGQVPHLQSKIGQTSITNLHVSVPCVSLRYSLGQSAMNCKNIARYFLVGQNGGSLKPCVRIKQDGQTFVLMAYGWMFIRAVFMAHV